MLIDLYRRGRLDLDAFVTETIALDQVEQAFERMHHGDVLPSGVVLGRDGRSPHRRPPSDAARPVTSGAALEPDFVE